MNLIRLPRTIAGRARYQFARLRTELERSLPAYYTDLVLYRRFRNRGARDGSVVLFASYDPGISVRKHWMGHLEILIAKHLEFNHGARPVFFLKNRNFFRWNIFRGFGLDEFYFADEWKSDHPYQAELETVKAMDFDQIAQHWFQGVPIGRLVSASVRRLQQKSKLETPADRELLMTKFDDALKSLTLSQRLLDKVQPNVVINNHVTYIEQGGMMFHAALARGIPTFCIRARNDQIFVIRRYTMENSLEHPNGLSPEDLVTLKSDPQHGDYIREGEDKLKGRIAGEYKTLPQTPQIGLKNQRMSADGITFPDPEKPLVGVFTHLPWDASGSFYEDLFPTLRDWIEFTTQTALQNDCVNWIFRIHPSEGFRGSIENTEEIIRSILPEKVDHIRIIESKTPISSYALIPRLSAGVTVRSTLAMELPCMGIPVVCAGTGPTSVGDYNIFAQSPEQYRDLLMNIQTLQPLEREKIEEALLVAYGFFTYTANHIECVDNFLELAAMRKVTPEKIVSDKTFKRIATKILSR